MFQPPNKDLLFKQLYQPQVIQKKGNCTINLYFLVYELVYQLVYEFIIYTLYFILYIYNLYL